MCYNTETNSAWFTQTNCSGSRNKQTKKMFPSHSNLEKVRNIFGPCQGHVTIAKKVSYHDWQVPLEFQYWNGKWQFKKTNKQIKQEIQSTQTLRDCCDQKSYSNLVATMEELKLFLPKEWQEGPYPSSQLRMTLVPGYPFPWSCVAIRVLLFPAVLPSVSLPKAPLSLFSHNQTAISS